MLCCLREVLFVTLRRAIGKKDNSEKHHENKEYSETSVHKIYVRLILVAHKIIKDEKFYKSFGDLAGCPKNPKHRK